MNCNMRFRPVVCADGALLLPMPGGQLKPQRPYDGVRFGNACLHPEHPSRAVFQLLALPPRWPGVGGDAEPMLLTLQLDEAGLRKAAAELLELADEIALKPPKSKSQRIAR